MKTIRSCLCLILILTGFVFTPLTVNAEGSLALSKGQILYVPAYSHIYSGNREKPFYLTITLSIRNIDPQHPITITSIDYHESQGAHVKKILKIPTVLNALGSMRHVISEKDKSGGSGANFIVRWTSQKSVNPPIVETIMIGTQSSQGISFTSRGKVLSTAN